VPQPYTYPVPRPYANPYQQPYGNAYGNNNPYQQPYGNAYGNNNPYQQPYGNAFGYNNIGQAQATSARIDRIQRDLRQLASQRMISRNEYNNRLKDSREIERRFYRNARDGRGLTVSEMRDVQVRVARLEQRIARDLRDGRRFGYRW
jgi:hypothetical protein